MSNTVSHPVSRPTTALVALVVLFAAACGQATAPGTPDLAVAATGIAR